MAFFSIVRYTGEDDAVLKEEKGKSILQKLHEAAKNKQKLRKSQQIEQITKELVHKDDEISPTKKRKINDTSGEPLKSKKSKRVETSTDSVESMLSENDATEKNSSSKKSHDKKVEKKAKKSVSGATDEVDEIVHPAAETDKKSKKKKKSKKEKAVEGDDEIGDTKSDKAVSSSELATIESDQDKRTAETDDEDVSDKEKEAESKESFTVLGEVLSQKVSKVQRVLPHWLTHPTVITDDIGNNRTPLDHIKGLDAELIERLKKNGIKDFFPVQAELLPELLRSFHSGFLYGDAGFRPSDICCSAPTGSGKTLAYVLPLMQALRHRVVRQVRALVVLPVRDLVSQIYRVFSTYCKDTNIKVCQISGSHSFSKEQQILVRKGPCGYESQCDIVVSTPGRLVDHINTTAGFTLKHLRFLVIDEADRLMDDIQQDWLRYVEAAVYSTGNHDNQDDSSTWGSVTKEHVQIYGDIAREQPTMTVENACQPQLVLQKLLFSATLSQNPEKLQQMNLFKPKLFTSLVGKAGQDEDSERNPGTFVGKYTTPAGLTEMFVECSPDEKPLMMMYFIQHLRYRHILCFTNTVEAAHRLYWLIKISCNVEVREVTSKQLASRRNKIFKQFTEGKINILICSDAVARGMDLENVRYVISYDRPAYVKTYIHRSGRTARAGKVGTAITLLDRKEILHFKHMLTEAGKTNLEEMDVETTKLEPYVPAYTKALTELKKKLELEQRRK